MIYLDYWVNITFLLILFHTVLASDGIFRINYEVHRGNSITDSEIGAKPKFVRRKDSLEMELENMKTYYISILEIGSNEDKNKVLVDTGSSDLWVMASDVKCDYYYYSYKKAVRPKNLRTNNFLQKNVKATSNEDCLTYGSFDYENSNTFKKNNTASIFYIEYMDETYSIGIWGNDNVKINGATVEDLYFAVANQSSSNIGVLGIGPQYQETSDEIYPNLPFALKEQGIINKVAYSVFLNKPEADNGTILFGAVDSSKYTGSLGTLPIIDDYYYEEPISLQVLQSGLYFSDGKGDIDLISNYTIAALLDTGTTLSYLPPHMVGNISEKLNGKWSRSYGAYKIDCKVDSDYELIFDFNGQQIRVPISSFILKSTDHNCYLGIMESSYSYTLGDNFLRYAYMVVNLEDNEISLAQASFSDKDEDIQVISDSVPNASRVPNYSYTKQFDYITSTASVSANSGTGSITTISESESVFEGSESGIRSYTRSIIYTESNIETMDSFSTTSTSISTSTTKDSVRSSSTTDGSSSKSTSSNGSDSTSTKQGGLAGTIQPPIYFSSLLTILAGILIV